MGLAVAPISGQTQTSTTSSTTYIETSKLVGKPVKSSQGEEIGTIKDVVIDRNTGCMAYTVLSTGGGGGRVAGGGGKMVAVPWSVYSPQSDLSTYTVTVERERIFNAPVFEYARIEEYSRPDYINNVYSYYGVSPGVGVGVGVSGGASTTTTGAATTTTGAATTAGTSGVVTWTAGSGLPFVGEGPHTVALNWSWTQTSGTWNGLTCNDRNNNPCKAEGTFGPVQRAFVAGPGRSGPLKGVQVFESGVTSSGRVRAATSASRAPTRAGAMPRSGSRPVSGG